jgi:hypothetical protein
MILTLFLQGAAPLYENSAVLYFSLCGEEIEIDFIGMVESSDQEHSNERTNDYDSNLYCLLDFYCLRSCCQEDSREFNRNSANTKQEETHMEMERRGRRT